VGLRGTPEFDAKEWGQTTAVACLCDGADPLDALRSRSHPELLRRERDVTDAVAAIGLPESARIQPPENLEGDSVSCYFRFSSVKELDTHLRKLRRAVDDGAIARLLRH